MGHESKQGKNTMSQPFRWGILGLGNIAGQFATGLKAIPDATLAAVGSRSQEKADTFGEKFGAARRHGSYRALAEDPEVDAVYVASPHPMHKDDALLCLNHGKAVLCEKPFTINAREAEEVIAAARKNNAFLMEAMWSRFTPVWAKIRQLLAEGAIGEPRMLQADFGFQAGFDPKSRLFDPALGGGALLDVGVYCVSLASMLFGTPVAQTGLATLGATGIDEQSAFVLRYGNGELAVLSTAVRTNTPHEATILGTSGSIRVESPWWIPKVLTLSQQGKDTQRIEIPFDGNGYNYEALEVMDCVRRGETESRHLPLSETLQIMQTMDALRAQWGLKYPQE